MHTPQQTTLIGLCGPAGSGKDAVRSILENTRDFYGMAFADPIRGMLLELLVCSGNNVAYMERRDLKEVPVPGLGVSYRHMAQTLGTEWAREHFGADFWVRLAAARLSGLRGTGHRKFVVSDVRFANEAAWIRSQNGEVWLIERPGIAPVRAHASECVEFPVDRALKNDGNLTKLAHTTHEALYWLTVEKDPHARRVAPVVEHVAADAKVEGGAV